MSSSKKNPLIKTLAVAFFGIWQVIKKERNIKIHLAAAAMVTVLGLWVGLSRVEWAVIILMIFVVLAAETFNSAIEQTTDLLREKLQLDYLETKLIRDVSAGAVLLLAMASVIVGLVIFIPHLLSL